MILILFDVDGTLISTDGAGLKAFRSAMLEVFEIDIDVQAIHPDGKTDPLILKEFLEYYESTDRWSDSSRDVLFDTYLDCLTEELVLTKQAGKLSILPGVRELLDLLSSQHDFCVGLATGNLESGAKIKLESAGLNEYFLFGGFGSDSEDRTELTRIGIERGRRTVYPASVESVFVVGDTPYDIIHGRAAGADVIAVAGGRYSIAELHDCSPDLVLADLIHGDRVISFMRESAEHSSKKKV